MTHAMTCVAERALRAEHEELERRVEAVAEGCASKEAISRLEIALDAVPSVVDLKGLEAEVRDRRATTKEEAAEVKEVHAHAHMCMHMCAHG